VRPSIAPDGRIGDLEQKIAASDKATAAEKTKAAELEKEVEKVKTEKKEVAAQLEEAQKAQTALADTAAEAEKKKKEAEEVMGKLKTAAGGAAVITVDGGDVRVALNENFLFKANDDEITEAAAKVLDKIAIVLKETQGRTIAVHGHTSNQQPPQPRASAPPPPPKRGQKPPPAPPAPIAPVRDHTRLRPLRRDAAADDRARDTGDDAGAVRLGLGERDRERRRRGAAGGCTNHRDGDARPMTASRAILSPVSRAHRRHPGGYLSARGVTDRSVGPLPAQEFALDELPRARERRAR
jgi:outer membrane protein OmpA-like peptidoglycan-associated protein